jgi:hypothetical protein
MPPGTTPNLIERLPNKARALRGRLIVPIAQEPDENKPSVSYLFVLELATGEWTRLDTPTSCNARGDTMSGDAVGEHWLTFFGGWDGADHSNLLVVRLAPFYCLLFGTL